MKRSHARRFTKTLLVLFSSTFVASGIQANEPVFAEFRAWLRDDIEAAARTPDSRAHFSRGIALAKERRLALQGLIKTNPAKALACALPDGARSNLPSEIVAELETRVSGLGNYIVRAVDGDGGGAIARYLDLAGKRYRVYVDDRLIAATTKFQVEVNGIAVGSDLALAAISEPDATTAPFAWTTGNKQLLVIRIDFADLAGDPRGDLDQATYTANYVRNLVDTQVAPFYARSSFGLTTLTTTASTRLYRMPQTSAAYVSSSDNDRLFQDAINAAASDYVIDSYDRIVVLFSRMGMRGDTDTASIVYGGLSDVGARRTWINGRFTFGYLAHELGHSYGLFHASLWQVDDGNPISPNGTNVEYGDDFDIMGRTGDPLADFNPWFKNLLGWIPDERIVTVSGSGTYRINRFDSITATGPLALRIRKDGRKDYWIGCRRNFTSNASMQNGAYIFWGSNEAAQSQLLDLTTPGTSDQDAALAIGATLADPTADITIRPLAQGTVPTQYMDIEVTTPPASPVSGLANISTRAHVGRDEDVAIGGFIITGPSAKRVMIRGTGPSLAGHIAGALTDPVLELHNAAGQVIATNDNWRDNANAPAITTSGLVPGSENEAALLLDLVPGSYTAVMRGANEGTGIGVVEMYDLEPGGSSRLANISTRGFVQTNDDVMIGGLIVRDGAAKTVLVRATGPSLRAAGIQRPLEDPTLELHDGNGVILASNDDWQNDQRMDVEGSGLRPADDFESAIVATLDPGNYTAIVRGKNNSAGVALIEVYDLR